MEGIVRGAERLLCKGPARPQQGGAVDQKSADGRAIQLGGRLRRGVDVQLRFPLLLLLTAACRGPLCRRGRGGRSNSQLCEVSSGTH